MNHKKYTETTHRLQYYIEKAMLPVCNVSKTISITNYNRNGVLPTVRCFIKHNTVSIPSMKYVYIFTHGVDKEFNYAYQSIKDIPTSQICQKTIFIVVFKHKHPIVMFNETCV